jgi:hypothetical protein
LIAKCSKKIRKESQKKTRESVPFAPWLLRLSFSAQDQPATFGNRKSLNVRTFLFALESG